MKEEIMGATIIPSPDKAITGGGLEGEDLSLRQAIRILRKRLRVVIGIPVATTLLALIISFVLRPYYSSTASIELQTGGNEFGGSLGAMASSLSGDEDLKTDIQTEVSVLQSDDLGIETIERLHFEDHQRSEERSSRAERAPQERGLPLIEAPNVRGSLLGNFESHLKIVTLPDTRLIQITFEDPDARFAADAVNALIDQYVLDRLQRRNSSTMQATGWMTGELNDLKKQVQGSEQNLIDYQRESGLIVTPGANSHGTESASATSPVVDRLTQLNANLVSAETNRITQEALFRLAESGDVDALSSTALEEQAAGANGSQSGLFSGLLALRQQQTSLKLQMASASQTLGAKNPRLAELESQLASVDEEIKNEVKRIVNTTSMNYKAALQTENGVRSAYEEEEQKALKMNDSAIRLAVLQQEADSTRSLYEDLYTKLQELKLSVGTESSNIAVISRALPSPYPAHPRKGLNIAIGLLCGLVLGVLTAFLLDSLDDTVSNFDEVEKLSGVPVLAAIPQFSSPAAVRPNEQKSMRRPGMRKEQPYGGTTSEVSEAYRALRTAILLSHPGKPPRTLLVSSAVPGEGKTTTCYGLGACFAMLGNRVLLIDGDMRRPALNRYLETKNTGGLSNLLTSTSDWRETISEDPGVKNLYILPSGPVPPNPAELLESKVFDDLIETLSNEFDLILLDSPPAMVVTDASILSVKVDEVLVVVRWGSTMRSALARLFENFRRSRARVLGIVLNSVNTQSAEYYYDRGYYGTDYASEDKNANPKS